MKHIGILAHSFEGAALCFRTACLEGVKRLGPHMHPEITMTCNAMALVLDAWDRGDNKTLRGFFMEDAKKLAAAGCDFFVIPDNTAHIAMESEGDPFPIAGLNIGEVVADQAQRAGRKKVGILGTRFTMGGPVYPGAFGRRGIDWAVPDEADRKLVDDIIFDELCLGVFSDHARNTYVGIIEKLKADGCDAVALVCTEIPLLVSQEDSPLPILDSTRLLAAVAIEVALGERPMPEWRGGPIG
ncbi:amino acid racemase [Sphingomonas sp. RB56-2]|uniref:Amino acid racemase n=1 Tax=Sphingomonas brevis TaxID=2908206 RepID=A0ABT0S953_9SPHN|nr:amino acid racemase [Sphingomonas brevis]MCL6740662.1 amino acid racemase [Sphingomonas brevis]